jgi:hypothetical protein
VPRLRLRLHRDDAHGDAVEARAARHHAARPAGLRLDPAAAVEEAGLPAGLAGGLAACKQRCGGGAKLVASSIRSVGTLNQVRSLCGCPRRGQPMPTCSQAAWRVVGGPSPSNVLLTRDGRAGVELLVGGGAVGHRPVGRVGAGQPRRLRAHLGGREGQPTQDGLQGGLGLGGGGGCGGGTVLWRGSPQGARLPLSMQITQLPPPATAERRAPGLALSRCQAPFQEQVQIHHLKARRPHLHELQGSSRPNPSPPTRLALLPPKSCHDTQPVTNPRSREHQTPTSQSSYNGPIPPPHLGPLQVVLHHVVAHAVDAHHPRTTQLHVARVHLAAQDLGGGGSK